MNIESVVLFFLKENGCCLSAFSWVCIFNLNDPALALRIFYSKPSHVANLLSRDQAHRASKRNVHLSPLPICTMRYISSLLRLYIVAWPDFHNAFCGGGKRMRNKVTQH